MIIGRVVRNSAVHCSWSLLLTRSRRRAWAWPWSGSRSGCWAGPWCGNGCCSRSRCRCRCCSRSWRGRGSWGCSRSHCGSLSRCRGRCYQRGCSWRYCRRACSSWGGRWCSFRCNEHVCGPLVGNSVHVSEPRACHCSLTIRRYRDTEVVICLAITGDDLHLLGPLLSGAGKNISGTLQCVLAYGGKVCADNCGIAS